MQNSHFRRVLSLILAVIMCFSLLPASAMAEETEEVTETAEATEQISEVQDEESAGAELAEEPAGEPTAEITEEAAEPEYIDTCFTDAESLDEYGNASYFIYINEDNCVPDPTTVSCECARFDEDCCAGSDQYGRLICGVCGGVFTPDEPSCIWVQLSAGVSIDGDFSYQWEIKDPETGEYSAQLPEASLESAEDGRYMLTAPVSEFDDWNELYRLAVTAAGDDAVTRYAYFTLVSENYEESNTDLTVSFGTANTYVSAQRDKFVQFALNQVNQKTYDENGEHRLGAGLISACARVAGMTSSQLNINAVTASPWDDGAKQFKLIDSNNGKCLKGCQAWTWKDFKEGRYTPQKGDIVFYGYIKNAAGTANLTLAQESSKPYWHTNCAILTNNSSTTSKIYTVGGGTTYNGNTGYTTSKTRSLNSSSGYAWTSDGQKVYAMEFVRLNFVIDSYTISFDANGGSGAPAAQTKQSGSDLTLSSTIPTRTGYKFCGWSTSGTAASAQYQPGSTYSAEGNATLYAVWEKVSITITAQPESITVNKGDTATLSVNVEYNGTGTVSYLWQSYNTYTNWWETAYDFGTSYTNPRFTVSDVTKYLSDYKFRCVISAPDAQSVETKEVTITVVEPEGVIDSGTCGDNLTWTLDSDGLLNISGTGDMYDYTFADGGPWASYSSSVKKIEICNGVTSIGDFAFQSMRSLTDVSIPLSVTRINDNAFYYCLNLTNISVPRNVTSIGQDAFKNCNSLESISIPSSVVSIGSQSFAYCYALKDISIPENLTYIGDRLFYQCVALESISIPSSIISIDSEAFAFCNGLKEITFEHSTGQTLTIGETAFYANTSDGSTIITTVRVVDTDSKNPAISGYDWSGSNRTVSYEQLAESETITITSQPVSCTAYEGDTAVLSVTADYTGSGELSYLWKSYNIYTKQWEDANDFATAYTNSLFAVDDVTMYMNDYRFMCVISAPDAKTVRTDVVTITVESSGPQTKTYDYLLYKVIDGGITITDCNVAASEYVTIPSHIDGYPVRAIGDSAFKDCTGITGISLPDGIKSIGSYAFYGCSGLYSIEIPNNTSVIGEYAFAECTGLSFITVPANVKTIGDYAFSNCTSMATMYYDDTESQWKKVSIGKGNESITNCGHGFWDPLDYDLPENLRWEPFGTVKFTVPDKALEDNAYFNLTLYVDGQEFSSETGKTYRRQTGQVYQKEMEISLYEIEALGQCSGDYQVKVFFTSTLDWRSLPGAWTEIYSYTVPDKHLAVPADFSKNGNVVTWPEVEGADGYGCCVRKSDGNIICDYRVDTNSFDLTQWYAQSETSGVPYTIEVESVSVTPLEIANSAYSDALVIDDLPEYTAPVSDTYTVSTYDELVKAVQAGNVSHCSIIIPSGASITLKNDLQIQDALLDVEGTLIVPSGVSLSMSSLSTLIVYGTVDARKGSSIELNNTIWIGGPTGYSGENPWTGNLTVNGSYSLGSDSSIIISIKDGNKSNASTNLPKDVCLIKYFATISNDDTLDSAASYVKDYKSALIMDQSGSNITLSRKHNLGGNVELGLLGAELTLNSGSTLILGQFYMFLGDQTIVFSKGSGLYLLNNLLNDYGYDWYSVPEGTSIDDYYFRNEEGHTNYADSLEEFTNCLENGISCEVRIETELDIPSGTSITIAENTALTNNGLIKLKGNLRAESGASIVNNGTIIASSVSEHPDDIIEGNPVTVSILNSNIFKDAKLLEKISDEYAEDDCFTAADARKITVLDISNLGISNLAGLEYFSSLENLDCSGNYIKTLDVSEYEELKYLNCSNNMLTTLNLGSSPIIELDASGNEKLETVDISSCAELTEFSFAGCTLLKSVTLPAGIKTIPDGAFKATSLETVTIPDGVETISAEAYMDCTSLSSVSIPESVKEIGIDAFEGCTKLNSISYAGTKEQWEKIEIEDTGLKNNVLEPALSYKHEHNYTEEILREPGCETEGQLKKTCTICGDVLLETIKATGHTVIEDEEIEATCTEPGEGAGTHCSVCGELLDGHESIKAKDHSFVDNNNINNHICTECGIPENEGKNFRVELDERYIENEAILLKENENYATISVKCGEDTIPAEYFSYSYKITEGESPATVDENGLVTATDEGTVSVQVSLKNGKWISDLISLAIKKPAPELLIYKSGETEHTNLIEVQQGESISITTKYGDLSAKCSFKVTSGKGLSITETQYGAEVKADSTASGSYEVTATTKRIQTNRGVQTNVTVKFNIIVADYTPKLENSDFTLDSVKDGKVTTALTAQGGNNINSVLFYDAGSGFGREYTESTGDIIASYNETDSELTLTATRELQNKTRYGTLVVSTDNGEVKINGIKITISNSAISTNEGDSKSWKELINSQNTSSQGKIELKATLGGKNEVISEAYLTDPNEKLESIFDSETGIMTISLKDTKNPIPNNKNYQCSVTYIIEGYANAITRTINLPINTDSIDNTKISFQSDNGYTGRPARLSLAFGGSNSSSGSGSIYDVEGSAIALKLYSGKEELDLSSCEVKGDESQTWVDVSLDKDSNDVILTLDENPKAGKVKIFVKDSNWADWVETSYQLKLSSKLTAKLGSKKLNLSSTFGGATASTTLKSDMCNLAVDGIVYSYSGNSKLSEEARKIGLDYEDGKLIAYMKDPSDCPKNGSYNFKVTPHTAGGKEYTALTVTVAVAGNLPEVKLSGSALNLDTLFTDRKAYTDISLNSKTVDLDGFTVSGTPEPIPTGSAKAVAEAEKIQFLYNENTGRLSALLDSENLPKAGSYSFVLKLSVTDGAGIESALKDVKFKVTVGSKIPTVSLTKTSVTMNTVLAGTETVQIPVKISTQGYSIAGFAESLDELQYEYSDAVGLSLDGNTLVATLKDSSAKKTYKIKLTPILMDITTGQTIAMSKQLVLTVKTAALTPTASVKVSGSIDMADSESAVTAAPTFKNISGTPTAVKLSGQNAAAFKTYLTKDAKGNTVAGIKLKDSSLKAGTYKLTLVFTVNGRDVSASVSVKLVQGKIKLAAVEARKMFQNQSSSSTLSYRIEIASPANARIESISIGKLNSKLQSAINSACGSISWSIDDEGATVTFAPGKAYKYQRGNYEIPVTVTPEGGKPVAVKLKLTVSA